MPTIDLIPPDPRHEPDGGAKAALLYPLWVLHIELKPYPRAKPRSIRFSVDGVRGVPLPIKHAPETEPQEVGEDVRLLPAIPESNAQATTRHFIKQGLGPVAGFVARVKFLESRKVWKLFWRVEGDDGAALIDSRAGTVIPMPDDLPLEA